MAFTIKENNNGELEITTRNRLDVSKWNAEQKLQYLVDTDVFLNGRITDELRKELKNHGYNINSDGGVEKIENSVEKSPVIFSITKEEEIRYYRNDNMNLNDLIKRYSNCERPFIELGETSQRIDTMQFVELEQTVGTTSIEIVPDENRVTVYENKGNDVYENNLGDEFAEYKLSELLNDIDKQQNKDENFKINNEFYHSLPRNERYIEVVPAKHAQEIMQQLADKGIEFSAVSRQNNKAAITVHTNNKDELKESAKNAVDKQIKKKQPEISKSENKERINPEYYKKLAPADRHIQRITKSDTDKVISALESKGIEFSAVKSDKFTAITVHKDNKAVIGQALLESYKAAAKEYINSDYFKSLPADQRAYSQTADLKAAKDMMNSLEAADIKYSAVIDNERSTAKITIAKQDIQQAQKSGALFSRQSQRAYTNKAQAQNNERAAAKTAALKKDEQSL